MSNEREVWAEDAGMPDDSELTPEKRVELWMLANDKPPPFALFPLPSTARAEFAQVWDEVRAKQGPTTVEEDKPNE